ncbi:unnamed protein product [Blepharisma stoltei]|uniref:Uncharacterized protein n=1 Tax=Blepharisma stoltei TaxID=1481888 RepID=A0AAU9I8K5_9CILI|nr:unnamed protein product [Blepharisma stoltei]
MKSSKSKPEFVLDCASTMSKMSEYNGLRDGNLAGFFASKKRRKLLWKHGLITKGGLIVDKTNSSQFSETKRSKPYLSSAEQIGSEENAKTNKVQMMSPKAVTIGKKTFEKKEVKPLSSDELKQMLQKYRKPYVAQSQNTSSTERMHGNNNKIDHIDSSEKSPGKENKKKEQKKPVAEEKKKEAADKKPAVKENEEEQVKKEIKDNKEEQINRKPTVKEEKDEIIRKQTIEEKKEEIVEGGKAQQESRKQTVQGNKDEGVAAEEEVKNQAGSKKPTIKESQGIEEGKELIETQISMKEENKDGLNKKQTIKKEEQGPSEIQEEILSNEGGSGS